MKPPEPKSTVLNRCLRKYSYPFEGEHVGKACFALSGNEVFTGSQRFIIGQQRATLGIGSWSRSYSRALAPEQWAQAGVAVSGLGHGWRLHQQLQNRY